MMGKDKYLLDALHEMELTILMKKSKYTLTSDQFQWKVEEILPPDGENRKTERNRLLGYYTTLRAALSCLPKDVFREASGLDYLVDFSLLIRGVKRLVKQINGKLLTELAQENAKLKDQVAFLSKKKKALEEKLNAYI